MNILNLLRSRDEVSVQAYIPTKSGKLIMSVVGGEGLYSSPRKKNKNRRIYYTRISSIQYGNRTMGKL